MQKQVKREEMRKHVVLRYNLLQVWRAFFRDQCHVYIQFHRICRWPHIEVGHLENDQVQARKILGQRQTMYFDITLFHSRSNEDQCLHSSCT